MVRSNTAPTIYIFMSPNYYLVIDFEATCCDQESIAREQMEIIEIGAVLASAESLAPVSEYQAYVRPVRNPTLTPFCTQLTSIRQADVDAAPDFPSVIAEFKRWLYPYQDYVFGSWGDYDLKQLTQDCAYHHVPYPINGAHINLKRLFTERQKLRKKPGLANALQCAGLSFEGTHHRGIDDARNIVRLLPYIFGEAVTRGRP